jgi:hypothetical protein
MGKMVRRYQPPPGTIQNPGGPEPIPEHDYTNDPHWCGYCRWCTKTADDHRPKPKPIKQDARSHGAIAPAP